jgi:hypothetical protein
MRKLILTAVGTFIIVLLLAAPSGAQECTTIQDRTLLTSGGETIVPGYDQYGYNYQAHMYNGRYCEFRRGEPGWWDEFCHIDLGMKWNEAWLSNKDCDDDGKLDRHYGFSS